MCKTIRIIGVSLCVIPLSACMLNDPYDSSTDVTSYHYESSELYPDGYAPLTTYDEQPMKKTNVVVPESYHVGAYHTPISPKHIDKDWVERQNSSHYTIEIANDEKAARVATALQKTPKTERTAEIQYQQNGKAYYKGVYGSYDSEEAAQAALSTLPDDLKQNAGITTWGNVQRHANE